MPASQIKGGTTASVAEVEATSRALRGTLRSEDYGSLGIYRVAGNSGVMAAALTASSPIFAFRWGANGANICAIRKVLFTAAVNTAGFTAGSPPLEFRLLPTLSYTANASGGTALTPSGNQNKMRTSMATSLVTDIRISTTGALTAGTWVTGLLTQGSLGALVAFGSATAGKGLVVPGTSAEARDGKAFVMFEARPGEYPLVLSANEGFALFNGTSNFPAAGTWRFAVNVVWEELSVYPI